MKRLRASHLQESSTPDLMSPSEGEDGVVSELEYTADRGNWTGKLDFLLSCIGYCVGLGNVWRFPYRTYSNGGGAFLIPYFIMLGICGIPIFFMELSLGQFSSLGPLAVWKISPFFKGAGVGMIVIVSLVAIYYNMIIAYVLFYLFASLTSDLPWQHCGNWWNTDRCLDHRVVQGNNSSVKLPGSSLNITGTVSPSEEYWSRYVLHIQGSSGIGSPGGIRWNLCLCLLLAWIIVYLCILKGVKSSGKVVYFTATFPYVILVMLLIRGVTLDGAWKGIKFYLTPQFDHLLTSKVWIEAALQIFYSLGVGFGGLLTFASYNTFNQNIYRDTFIVTLGNAFTSILAGFAIFSVLGYMSQELGVPVDQVAQAGHDNAPTFSLLVLPVLLHAAYAGAGQPGVQRFSRDIKMMLGFEPGIYFKMCWNYLSPLSMLALLVYSIVKYEPSEYGTYKLPKWAEILGIFMGLLPCLMVPTGMVVSVLREEGTLKERIKQAIRPSLDWGPALEENRTGIYVNTLPGSQSPRPLMVHMRKYGGITCYENTAIELDKEIEMEEESMM
ncbi:sodium-dependent proline transporter isoform X3 [Lepisosteus oculatus]|uniref:sodium-dependent proline transporter isoform X3 n=1 Tax=Lepisosteus oculatus TaxID=7918 RepID=UPI0035F520B1